MIKWGIIGLGNMARKFANSIDETKNSKLIGIASLSDKRLKSFKEDFKISEKNAHLSYESLIGSKDIDAIYIATLNNTHLEIIKKCAENKKDILCEKPFTLNDDEAIIANNFIKKNNVNFYEGIAYRTHDQTKIIKEILDQKEIGEIISIESSFGFKVKKIKVDSRLFSKKLGGGSILDLGCYPLSFLNLLFKDNNNYKISDASGGFTTTGVDDHAEAEIIINDSINCSLKVSIKDNLDNKIKIKGFNGEIIVNNPWLPDKKSTLDIKSGSSFHKKFINSQLNIYSNQIQKISDNFEKKINDDKFAVDISDSIHIMKNLSLWSNLIKQ
tara:strand:- start:6223 stop:7206 length:984 start_codon:yes stop_codon:yes gene_type:complete